MTRLAALLVLGVLAAWAAPSPGRTAQTCAPADAYALQGQRRAADHALQPIEVAHAASLARLEQAPPGPLAEAELDRLLAGHDAARRPVLEALASGGNAEAMVRLADGVRDSGDREDVARWLALTACAAGVGHPTAHDELVRWWWHQRGDGSVAQVQRNRALALDFAEKAAAAGHMASLARIGVYIAGDVHQYPASLPLARRVMELCARAGSAACQENLVGGPSYDYGQTPIERSLWLARLAARQPDRFAARRDAAWGGLGPEDRLVATRLDADWRPVPWSELQDEWRELRADILRHGETSAGVLPNCATTTPWCRGN